MDTFNDIFSSYVSTVNTWLETIINSSPVPTFVMNCNHEITHWNRACEIVVGVNAEKIVGSKDVWKIFYPNSEKRPIMADLIIDGLSDEAVKKYYSGKCSKSKIIPGTWEIIDYFPHFSGGKWISINVSTLFDLNGKVVGAIETLQDITPKIIEERTEIRKRLSDIRANIDEVLEMLH